MGARSQKYLIFVIVMEKIIDPVDVRLLIEELTPDKKFMDTNKGNNEIYIVTWQDSPNVVTEIGRLREIAFRAAGGSTLPWIWTNMTKWRNLTSSS